MTLKRKNRGIALLVSGFLAVSMFLGSTASYVSATEPAPQTTMSSDAYLKALSVDPGTMTPAFSPNVTEYTITVAENIDKLNVTCSTEDSNASVIQAGGFKDLQMGNNSAIITVQAQDGTLVSYNITIIRGGAPGAVATTDPAQPTTDSVAQDPAATTDPATPDVTADPNAVQDPAAVADPAIPQDSVATAPAVVGPVSDSQFQDAVFGIGKTIPNMVADPALQIGVGEIYADYYVVPSFDPSLVPQGFVLQDYSFRGYPVQSAYFEPGNIRLLYMATADGGNAGMRLYYEDSDDVLDFVPFKEPYGNYVFPVRYQAQIPVPLNYTGSWMPFEKEVVACYIYTELTGNPLSVQAGMESKDTLQPGESTADADPVPVNTLDEVPEFYLFYGMNSRGEEGFYLFDHNEGTCQRYVERDTSYDLDQSYFKYKDRANLRLGIIAFLIVLLIVAIFVIINLSMKNRDLKDDLGYGDGGDDPDDSKKSRRKKKSEDYEEESYDEYGDDEYSDEEYTDEEYSDDGFEEIEFEDGYTDEEYADEEYSDEEYADEEYSDEEYADEEYADEEYSDEEYSDEEYSDEEYSDDEDVEEDEEEDIPAPVEMKRPINSDIQAQVAERIQRMKQSQVEQIAKNATGRIQLPKSVTSQGSGVTPQSGTTKGASKVVTPSNNPKNRLINLTRESVDSSVDDDFEFEFIHFDDNNQ